MELSKANLFCFLWVGNSKTAHKGGCLGRICMLLFTSIIILKGIPRKAGQAMSSAIPSVGKPLDGVLSYEGLYMCLQIGLVS